jgi:VIT1/CCC1 family predicted Fe2+/Mn2+ transporter
MFKDQENFMKIGAYLAHLDQLSFFAESEKDPKEVKSRKEAILQGRWVLSSHYSEQVLGQTKSGVRYTNERNAQKAFYSRFVMAVGGFALLVPMLIMTLHSSKVTSLVTTSVFVLAGAVSLAWFMDTAEPKDTIGATVAYAAVLVVFVGVGTPTPAGS